MALDHQAFQRYSRFLQTLSQSLSVLGAKTVNNNPEEDAFVQPVRNNELNKVENVILDQDLSKDSAALEIAAKNGHHNIVDWLLKHRRLLESSGRSALSQAIYKGHSDIAISLINAGFSSGRNTYGETLLFVAASGNNVRMTEYLILQGCDMHALTRTWTPLHVASFRNHRHVVMMLLKHGSDPNIKNKDGHSALDLALFQGHIFIIQYFLQAGCKFNMQDQESNNAIQSHLQKYPAVKAMLAQEMVEPKTLLDIARKKIRQCLGQHLKQKTDSLAKTQRIPAKVSYDVLMEDVFPSELLKNEYEQ